MAVPPLNGQAYAGAQASNGQQPASNGSSMAQFHGNPMPSIPAGSGANPQQLAAMMQQQQQQQQQAMSPSAMPPRGNSIGLGAGSPGFAGSPAAAGSGDTAAPTMTMQQQQQAQFVQMAFPAGLDREKLAALSQVSRLEPCTMMRSSAAIC